MVIQNLISIRDGWIGDQLRRFRRRAKERKGSEKAEEKDRRLLKRELKEGVEDEKVLEYEEG